MKQYLAAKTRYPRHLLFFRIGDFFELFFEDAKTASRALGLTLTSRHKGADAVPMAGVPAHTVEQYLARLLRQGFSVAICDQTEDALQAKGLIKRDVTRVVTPGTVLEENLLEAKKTNRLLAIWPDPMVGSGVEVETASRRYGLASVDMASGGIFVQELEDTVALRSELARLSPSECLLPEDPPLPLGQKPPSLLPLGITDAVAVARLKIEAFGAREAYERLVSRFGQNGRDQQAVASFKKLNKDLPLATCAVGALLGYIDETYAGGKVLLSPPKPFDPEKFLVLSDAAIRSLELLETLRVRSFEGSLLWAIDRTCTGPGSRCLREWLIRPLREIEPLKLRHDAVGALVEHIDLRAELRDLLKNLADIERIAARLSANRATPRDLVALKDSLLLLPKLYECLNCICGDAEMLPVTDATQTRATPSVETLLISICRRLTGLDSIAALIAQQLKDNCSNVLNEGGLMQAGVDVELDSLRAISSGGKEWIAAFQIAEAARSGIANLKIGYNRVFGYYIEISRANQHLAPKDYERRQTLTHAERYTTPALKEREAEVLGAEEKICALEQQLFLKLREQVAQSAELLQIAGQALAELDALCSLAEVAHKKGHTRPIINDFGRLRFEQMRHPVLEDTLPKGELVPNDLSLATHPKSQAEEDDNTPQILLLTGPNMAGKSTYIRASALCVILAQMGAFVPAEKAEIGLVDRIFTRVGAADDVAGGRSTFMIEMMEVAEILAACSTNSLLILDEVGRGTSTYDGVSLAWALTEYLHNGLAKPRTLFATHYHELCALEDELPRVKNASAAVKEWQGEITFLHRIVMGPSERSFGIHVARLAGLPASVLNRARDILEELENEAAHRVDDLTQDGAQMDVHEKQSVVGADFGKRRRLKPTASDGQLLLFEPAPDVLDPSVKELLETLRALDPREITPLEALNALDRLVRKVKGVK
ncbi:MAG: DNA mismatch repair protein MutS [Planctomycetota bacterium]